MIQADFRRESFRVKVRLVRFVGRIGEQTGFVDVAGVIRFVGPILELLACVASFGRFFRRTGVVYVRQLLDVGRFFWRQRVWGFAPFGALRRKFR